MVISFLPTFKGDLNYFQYEPLDRNFFENLKRAKAVIFSPTVPKELYFFVKHEGIAVFPEYTLRFLYPGKIGQMLLIKSLGLPHPETVILPRICGLEENPYKRRLNLKFPVVIKGNLGDEGTEVFLIKNEQEFKEKLKILKTWELTGRFGFIIQEYLPEAYDARSVVIGEKIFIFFREGGFRKNLVQEGKTIPPPKEKLREGVYKLTKKIVEKTRFNLVAIDFLFKKEEPLVSEFNFTFGRRAIGEKNYERYLKKAIKNFLKKL